MKKINQYEPTVAEKRILEVALNPEYQGKSIKEKCKAANTSKVSWYKAMNKPEFIEVLNSMTMDLLKGKVNDIINATYKFAVNNPKCSSDRKILLTMAGLYTDKAEIKADIDSEQEINVNIRVID